MTTTAPRLILAALGGLALAACGGQETKTVTVPAGDGGTATVKTTQKGDAQEVTITGKDGKTTATISAGGEGAAAPANLPAFAPAYPGAKIDSSIVGSGPEGSGGVLVMTTPDSPDKVAAFYEARMKAANLADTTRFTNNDMQMIGGTAGEKGPSANVTISPNPAGGTQINLIYVPAP
jgi:hypothetical protein